MIELFGNEVKKILNFYMSIYYEDSRVGIRN